MTYYILNADGTATCPADALEWAKFFETTDRQIARDETKGVTVSTVFLGIDHRICGDGPPVLFETLVLGGPLDQGRPPHEGADRNLIQAESKLVQ